MRLLTLIIFNMIGLSLMAQNGILKNQEFSFSVGVGEIFIEKFPQNENLDFINYVDAYPEYIDYFVAKLGYKFDLFSNISADIKMVLMDDLIPDNYDVSIRYFLNSRLGMGIGSMLHKSYITYFEEYHIQTFPEYYLVNENVQQFTIYDLGFYLSPTLIPIDKNVIKFTGVCTCHILLIDLYSTGTCMTACSINL